MVPKKMRKIALWTLLVVMLAGLVWAGLDLLGQSNKSAADAGSSAADMEMASLDSIKQSTKSACDWNQERALRKKIDAADASYRTKLASAKSEIERTGKVSESTRSAGIALAKQFQNASENYAAFWDKNNGKTRARLAREAGASRVKSAEMAFNNVDASKIDAYNDQQASLRKAQKAYFSEAKEDVSPQDLASLKSSLTPKLEKMGSDLMALVQSVTNILSQVKDQVGSTLSVGGIGGCAKQVATGGGTAAVNDGVASLLSPLQSLLSLVQSMGNNVQGMLSDIATF